jgi:hypothetical protein
MSHHVAPVAPNAEARRESGRGAPMALIRTLTVVGMVGGGLFLAAPAQASGPPVGSCPDGYTLVSASLNPDADHNGDGLICESGPIPTRAFHNFIDNTVQG